MRKAPKIGVVGSGSWATAIVKILLENFKSVNWWVREQEIVDSLLEHKNNGKYLSTVKFDTNKLRISTNINEIVESSDYVLFCVPAAFLSASLKYVDPKLLEGKKIISAIKGIVPDYNMIVFDYLEINFGTTRNNFVVVSGPSHAEEVAQEKLTYLTIASENPSLSKEVSQFFACHYINTACSDDIYGTEYAPVVKNVIAIACGIAVSLGYGDNFQAVLISNAIQEIDRFMQVVHPIERDIKDSVYLGDLLVTAYSRFSRNRTFGTMIGKGYSVKFAQYEMEMVAEGYYAAKGIHYINGNRANMPICTAVYRILYENAKPKEEMANLARLFS